MSDIDREYQAGVNRMREAIDALDDMPQSTRTDTARAAIFRALGHFGAVREHARASTWSPKRHDRMERHSFEAMQARATA